MHYYYLPAQCTSSQITPKFNYRLKFDFQTVFNVVHEKAITENRVAKSDCITIAAHAPEKNDNNVYEFGIWLCFEWAFQHFSLFVCDWFEEPKKTAERDSISILRVFVYSNIENTIMMIIIMNQTEEQSEQHSISRACSHMLLEPYFFSYLCASCFAAHRNNYILFICYFSLIYKNITYVYVSAYLYFYGNLFMWIPIFRIVESKSEMRETVGKK